ncbi:PREDICTED: dispanin subfamily A member 2b-like [Tinamus guttatus]|uniref:dispanin subfamily A member 2b-like n=1 Tax=Tinamus guttatus TaxID=94827 RepID=UPI00052EDD60|nr:PREDICTED: dispanin subfamily A member 2b-like [Tinamus guttatus]
MESGQKPYTQLPDSLDMEPLPQGATVVPVPPAVLPATLPPRDFLAWSLGSLMYFNCCCLGLMAVIFSIKSRDRKMLGDHSGALSYGSTAKGLNICR